MINDYAKLPGYGKYQDMTLAEMLEDAKYLKYFARSKYADAKKKIVKMAIAGESIPIEKVAKYRFFVKNGSKYVIIPYDERYSYKFSTNHTKLYYDDWPTKINWDNSVKAWKCLDAETPNLIKEKISVLDPLAIVYDSDPDFDYYDTENRKLRNPEGYTRVMKARARRQSA